MTQSGSQQEPLIQPMMESFQKFIHAQSTSGVLLLAATAVAMIWANSPWAESYETFWNTPVSLVVGSHALTETLLEWINDGLMAMFFFVIGLVIGLEIKREILVGELASFRQAALSLMAVRVIALIYTSRISQVNLAIDALFLVLSRFAISIY